MKGKGDRGEAISARTLNVHFVQMDAFRARSDTFSLGVCNGCQLLALLGWVAPAVGDDSSHSAKRSRKNPTAVPTPSPVVFSHNKSGRFESRFPTVKIEDSPAIMLKGMAGTSMGVWVSHGEGQLKCDDATLSAILVGAGERWATLTLLSHPTLFDTNYATLNGTGPRGGTDPLCGRRERADNGIPVQPERLAARHCGPVLARRAPSGHDAAPRAHRAAVELAVDARRVARHADRVAMDADVHQRSSVVRADAIKTGSIESANLRT